MRTILKDVTLAEMMTMRDEQGMSNQEIANALGVSYNTVRRLIGTQPKGIRRERSASIPTRPLVHRDAMHAEPKREEAPPAALVLAERSLSLRGEIGRYDIDTYARVVSIQIPEQGRFTVSLDDLRTLHNELGAIIRNEDKTKFGVEAW